MYLKYATVVRQRLNISVTVAVRLTGSHDGVLGAAPSFTGRCSTATGYLGVATGRPAASWGYKTAIRLAINR